MIWPLSLWPSHSFGGPNLIKNCPPVPTMIACTRMWEGYRRHTLGTRDQSYTQEGCAARCKQGLVARVSKQRAHSASSRCANAAHTAYLSISYLIHCLPTIIDTALCGVWKARRAHWSKASFGDARISHMLRPIAQARTHGTPHTSHIDIDIGSGGHQRGCHLTHLLCPPRGARLRLAREGAQVDARVLSLGTTRLVAVAPPAPAEGVVPTVGRLNLLC